MHGRSAAGTTRCWLQQRASRRDERLRAAALARRAAATPARPRSRTTRSRASTTTPTGSPTARSPGSTRSPADDDWFVLDELPRSAPSVGSAGVGGAARAAGATSTCRPAIRARARRSSTILAQKPRHWLEWYEGRFRNNEGGPMTLRARSDLTHDQIREVNALTHVENELIDEACGRVLRRIAERGWDADTDVFFTTDHGELQGDFGLLYKGPYHVDSLMRIPMIWRPAPSRGRRAGGRSTSRSASSTSPRRSARSPACRCRTGCEGAPLPDGARLGPRARHHRVGQPVRAGRHAPADDLPRRLHLHRLRADHARRRLGPRAPDLGRRRAAARPDATTAPRASCTTSARIRTSGGTCGTTRHTRSCARSWSPISTTICRSRVVSRCPWRRRPEDGRI